MSFRILAIDGGGVRGIFPAHILASLARQRGKLSETFDLIVGTSTGAIIAAAVATDFDLDQLCASYERYAPILFTSRFGHVGGTLRSSYGSEALQELLREVFQDKKFADVPGRLAIVATDVSNGNVFVMKSSYHPSFVRDGDIAIRDGVLASCAAPGYFDPVRVKEYLLADGGLWGNNPSLIAYTEAVGKLAVDANEVRLLSIGTGTGREYYDVGRAAGASWGLVTGWQSRKLINMIFNLQSQSAANIAGLLLGKRYLRISFEETRSLSLSDPAQMPSIKAKAAATFTYQHDVIERFLNS